MAKNPLTLEHLGVLNKAAANLTELADLVRKCDSCGLDVEQLEEGRLALLDRIERIKHNFFGPSASPLVLPEQAGEPAGGNLRG